MVSAKSLVVILTGPTASGKTAIALELARACREEGGAPIEIINADSLVVYRGFDIGTAKPTALERAEVPHHLVDISSPQDRYDVGDFVRDATNAIEEIHSRGARALIVGGTGFYLKSLLFGLWESPASKPALRAEVERVPSPALYQELLARDEPTALRIGGNDRYRLVRAIEILRLSGRTPTELQASLPQKADPRFKPWVLDRDPAELDARIGARTRAMLTQGFIEEVRGLATAVPHASGLSSVGYVQVLDFLNGKAPEGRKARPGVGGLQDEIELATRQLVKKQRTWNRSFLQKSGGEFFLLDRDHEALSRAAKTVYAFE